MSLPSGPCIWEQEEPSTGQLHLVEGPQGSAGHHAATESSCSILGKGREAKTKRRDG